MLGLPEPRVLAAAKKAWRADRKPANILLVLDTSGSMQEEDRLARAKAGLRVFFRDVGPNDRVGLLTFSDKLVEVAPIAPFSSAGEGAAGRGLGAVCRRWHRVLRGGRARLSDRAARCATVSASTPSCC